MVWLSTQYRSPPPKATPLYNLEQFPGQDRVLYTRAREALQQETKQLVTITVIGVNLCLHDLISVIITQKHTLNMNTQISSYDTPQGGGRDPLMTQRGGPFLGQIGGLGLKSGGDCLIQMVDVVHDKNRCTLSADIP